VLVGVDGEARVLDFGIAKAIGRLHETRDGKIRGKLPYMAPEQLERHDVTRQADVYAAAAVLWEALVGRPRMDVSNEMKIVHFVLHEAAPPPSVASPGLAPTYDDVVMRGLARFPTERYPTALAMLRDLEACGVASPAEVGAWVQELAPEELARRDALVGRAEGRVTVAPPPARPRRKRARVNPWFFALGIVSLAIGAWLAVLVARRTQGGQAATMVSATATASASASAAASASGSASGSASAAASASASAGAAPVRPLRRPSSECNPPWVVDAEGHKHYKEGCFTRR
jgi:serine/threonine-protein kinase